MLGLGVDCELSGEGSLSLSYIIQNIIFLSFIIGMTYHLILLLDIIILFL